MVLLAASCSYVLSFMSMKIAELATVSSPQGVADDAMDEHCCGYSKCAFRVSHEAQLTFVSSHTLGDASCATCSMFVV